MHVYSYLRVSSKGQIEGDGPERQRQAISAFCQTHNLTIASEFFERGVSGTIEGMDRPAFSQMLDSEDDRIEAIVVERVDRLARDLMVSELLLAECRKRNIAVYAADQGVLVDVAAEGGDPTRVLIRQILGALAQWEKSALVRKLRLARERVKKATGRCEGKKPYGEHPAEREQLQYILALREQSPPLGWHSIARKLNVYGLFNRSGKNWTGQQLHSMMKARRKKGMPTGPGNLHCFLYENQVQK